MRLKSITLSGFKSFARKTTLQFDTSITSIVGPNGSGKSNIAESFRFVLGEQSMKSMRGKRGEDLIWNGSNMTPRAGRASVTLTFDNTDRALNLDFDEITIERVVHRAGGNDYLLNGSVVRLRDIAELLSQANIGSSGHHIISQGEADRVLSSSPRERREMLEDALGLTGFLYKREEAERKLEKTGEHMREVMALRRELAPEVKFLSAQVQKIENAAALKEELHGRYSEYLSREHQRIKLLEAEVEAERTPIDEKESLDERIAALREAVSQKHDVGSDQLVALEREGRELRDAREKCLRELGSIEGELRAHERHSGEEGSIPMREARTFGESVVRLVEAQSWGELMEVAKRFLERVAAPRATTDVSALTERKSVLEANISSLELKEREVRESLDALRRSIDTEKDASREAERELFAAMAERSALESRIAALRLKEAAAREARERFSEEVREAAVLLGALPEYEQNEVQLEEEPRSVQEDRRRKLERLKIKIEEAGLTNSAEIMKEYTAVVERDQFLERELADLETSSTSLRQLIVELTETLEQRFSGGIEQINNAFQQFFATMFGGGTAALEIVKEEKVRRAASDEDDEDGETVSVEEGVDISISLPHKRVKGLHMLSGGERALTSIALIFAMSQVNPPPFLILDETDAALDEANSKRYGDIIETLARHSQLIVITHNRETMSRAGVLYGITMGSEGASKLLSIQFEEALAVAK